MPEGDTLRSVHLRRAHSPFLRMLDKQIAAADKDYKNAPADHSHLQAKKTQLQKQKLKAQYGASNRCADVPWIGLPLTQIPTPHQGIFLWQELRCCLPARKAICAQPFWPGHPMFAWPPAIHFKIVFLSFAITVSWQLESPSVVSWGVWTAVERLSDHGTEVGEDVQFKYRYARRYSWSTDTSWCFAPQLDMWSALFSTSGSELSNRIHVYCRGSKLLFLLQRRPTWRSLGREFHKVPIV